jgi:hypothetical protein
MLPATLPCRLPPTEELESVLRMGVAWLTGTGSSTTVYLQGGREGQQLCLLASI